MAASQDVTVTNLTGDWVLDKELSDDLDGVFELQGLKWFIRKALKAATLTFTIKSYQDDDLVNNMVISQSAGFGPKPPPGHRILNWTLVESTTDLGSMRARSRLIGGSEISLGIWKPQIEMQTNTQSEETNRKVKKFLIGDETGQGKETSGFVYGNTSEKAADVQWVHHFIVNNNGWTAEEIWGFEPIQGTRRLTRRLAVLRGGKLCMARSVFARKM